jgi:hypothetical protein
MSTLGYMGLENNSKASKQALGEDWEPNRRLVDNTARETHLISAIEKLKFLFYVSELHSPVKTRS